MIKAVVFDLDDTLCPEIEYVKSGFRVIATEFSDASLSNKLYSLFKENNQNVYQRAGFSDEESKRCIEIYRSHKPDIKLKDNVIKMLSELRSNGFKLGIITDGRPETQNNKIEALGLSDFVDKVIVTDELGGESFRKPNPKAFEIMKETLNVEFDEMVYVGDNPSKDFAIKSVYPIKTVRVMGEGLYSTLSYKDGIVPDYIIDDLSQLKNIL